LAHCECARLSSRRTRCRCRDCDRRRRDRRSARRCLRAPIDAARRRVPPRRSCTARCAIPTASASPMALRPPSTRSHGRGSRACAGRRARRRLWRHAKSCARSLGAIGICFALGVLSPQCARRCFGLDRGGPRGAARVQRPHAGPARPQSARSSAPVEAVSQNSRSRAKRPQWQAQQASM